MSPREGEPAARASVMVGGVVTQIDGGPLQGLALGQVIDTLRGPAGSRVELTIVRKAEAGPMTIAVTREPIRARALLQVRVEGGQLIVEAVGGRQVYKFQRAKPLLSRRPQRCARRARPPASWYASSPRSVRTTVPSGFVRKC